MYKCNVSICILVTDMVGHPPTTKNLPQITSNTNANSPATTLPIQYQCQLTSNTSNVSSKAETIFGTTGESLHLSI